MANNYDITNVKLNGLTIGLIKLNGNIVYPIGEQPAIDFPYDDCDCYIVYECTKPYSSHSMEMDYVVIDENKPYSINGREINKYESTYISNGSSVDQKIINLKPTTHYNAVPIIYHQLRLPTVTDLSRLFQDFGKELPISWSPQYFELHPYPTNMYCMFSGCKNLTNSMMNQLVPYFPSTSKVTNMAGMFNECRGLHGQEFQDFLSKFDTSSVTAMNSMFSKCDGYLTSLDLSKWDTSNVTMMNHMFFQCYNVEYLDLSKWDTSNVTNMQYMIFACKKLKELHLENWDTSNVTDVTSIFSSVEDCTIYIGEGWTLSTKSTWGGGENLKFIKYVPIESIDDLVCDVDATNVTSPSFTITPTITPIIHLNDLEVIYDGNYLVTDDNCTFRLKDGSQGQTLDITYRSKANPSISKTITITVADDLSLNLLVDFGYPTAPTVLPSWFTEQTKNATYHFTHKSYKNNITVYGLVEKTYPSSTQTYWNCYKVVAPVSGTLEITFRAYAYNSTYPFTIHCTEDATQPTYSSATNRVVNITDATYNAKDGKVNINVVAGETYYIHVQHRRYASSTISCGSCIRSFEIIPSISSISSIDLVYDIDVDNVEQSTFTIEPVIPNNETINDLEIVYDSKYMTINPTTHEVTLLGGSQGMSHTITYRSKADNSISKSITFYVNENLTSLSYVVNLAQFPTWFKEQNKDTTYHFICGDYKYDENIHGLVDYITSATPTSGSVHWHCYRLVAPTTGTLSIKYRANAHIYSSYPFTIHVNTQATRTHYKNETNRIACVYGDTCKDTDGIATFEVTQGTTYYIHVQYRTFPSIPQYGTCIHSIEIIPS